MVMRVNSRNADKLQLGGKAIVKVGCVFLAVSSTRMVDMIERIGKARTALTILINVWRSKVISRKTTDIQHQREVSPTVWPRNVSNSKSNLQQTAVLRQQMPEIHHVHPMARSQNG